MSESTGWILFPSITYANKARYYLGRAGVGSHMERIPESVTGKGCGYRLKVKPELYDKALEICIQNGIRMLTQDEELRK